MGIVQVDPSIDREGVASEGQDLPTVCVLCSHNCSLRVDVTEGALARVRPDANSQLTHGYACNKAASIGRYVRHAQRVTRPLRRRPEGGFEEVSWETAISEIGAKLKHIQQQHGGRAIGLVGVGGQGNHMDAGYALGFLQGLGSRRWFSAYAQEKTQNHLVDGWLMQASPSAILHGDTAKARYLLVLGTNPRISNRGHRPNDTFRALSRDPERRLVVVDPRQTETTRLADLHLRVRPGQDVYLLLALCASVVQQGLVDTAFLSKRTRNADIVTRLLADLSVDQLAARAGVRADCLGQEAARFASADGAAVMWDLGIEQGPFSTLNAYLLRLLPALTGNLLREGGMMFMTGFTPVASARERSPQERSLVADIPAIRALGNYGMLSPNLFPEEVLNDHPERLRAVVVEGANPLRSYADTPRWEEAFAALDLKVVIEPAMTETARLADYVLPTPTGYEKWEISGFAGGFNDVRIQLRPPVVPALEGPLPEPEIYVRLAEAMGLFGPPPPLLRALGRAGGTALGRKAFLGAALASAALAGKRARNGTQNRALFWTYRALGPRFRSPALAAIWLVSHGNAIERRAAVARALSDAGPRRLFSRLDPFALGEAMFQRILEQPEGALVIRHGAADHWDRHVGYADGRVRMSPAPMMAEIARALAAPERADPEFPWILAAGLRTRWTANTIHRDPRWRKGRGPHCSLSLSPEDAAGLEVDEGSLVRLTTGRGSAVLPAHIDNNVPPRFVSVPNGFGLSSGEGSGARPDGLNLNQLTDARYRDPFTGCPAHKHVPCRVERVALEAPDGEARS